VRPAIEAPREAPTAIDSDADLRIQGRSWRREPDRHRDQHDQRRQKNERYGRDRDVDSATYEFVALARRNRVDSERESDVRELNRRNRNRNVASACELDSSALAT
jgi:hypothetical protein